MSLTLASTVKLNTGAELPMLGFGTFQADGSDRTEKAVKIALEEGYRLIDTARGYENEADVGRALAGSGVPRAEVFVTTKLGNDDHGYESTLAACQDSLDKLGLDYLDLYLIHWPFDTSDTIESWRAMEELFDSGKCRAIGMSNFTVKHFEELLAEATVVPAVNQFEFHPFNYQDDVLAYCEDKGIQFQAYSPLVRAKKFDDPAVKSLAAKYGKSPAQILIRWALQRGVPTVPKSSARERIKANTMVFDFDIEPGDMQTLNSLNEGFRAGWYPDNWP